MKFSWDKELDWNETLSSLIEKYNKIKNDYFARKSDKRNKNTLVNYRKRIYFMAILITQLWNGSRVSEACEAINRFILTGKRELLIKAKKRGEHRKMIIPEFIADGDRRIMKDVIDSDIAKLSSKVKHFCSRTLGFNTHSLRYAWISMMTRRGIPAQTIAKITGHKKIDFILKYTQQRTAEDLFKETMKEIQEIVKLRRNVK